jgi:DNA modification methylase
LRRFQVLQGDALEVLRTLPDESVHCCVTSPPYWGLRDYGIPPSIWGGETVMGKTRTTERFYGDESRRFDGNHQKHAAGAFCRICGAWRGCFGLEPTYTLYVEHAVMVFREVRRVLRSDGTLWLNLGDSYNNTGKWGGGQNPGKHTITKSGDVPSHTINRRRPPILGLKFKDLVGIPWRVAFALQADGWWLRSDIVWAKPNPMPESVADRPTKAHEYLFLLAKSQRYYYDREAIMELASLDTHARYARGRSDTHKWADGGPGNQTIAKTFEHMKNRPPAGWYQGSRAAGSAPRDRRKPGVNPKCAEPGSGIKQNSSFSAAVKDIVEFRNKRSVWTIPTQPFPEAHFATFPEALVEPCILAGCPEGGTILDPFAGSGSVGVVALRHGRQFVGIEMNLKYVEMARRRIVSDAPLLNATAEAR